MRRNTGNSISSLIMKSGSSFVATLFFFVLGISAGIFTELMMENVEKDNINKYLDKNFHLTGFDDVTFTEIFFNSAGNNLGLLLIVVLAGITAIGFPAALAVLTYKGMALGFSAALLIETMSFKGVVLVFTSIIPQNLILIPAFLIASIAALNLAFYTISNRRFGIKKSLAESSGPYILLNVILSIVIVAGCFIESFISPILTQLIV